LSDLEALELDPAYVGWNLVTRYNAGDAQVKGAEINVQQSLEFLGGWGRRFNIFANGTKLELSGKSAASFGSFVPKSASWGVAFSYKRISMNARWNYLGLTRKAPQAAFGPQGYEYEEARTPMDFNAGYQVSRRFSLNLSINNVFNTPRVYLRYGPETPGYARPYNRTEFGTRLAMGLKGSF
jgi:iron complex outermembrane recepter protein